MIVPQLQHLNHMAAKLPSQLVHSRRHAPVVPTTPVHDVCSLHTDARAVAMTDRPSLRIRGVLTADDTLPAVEVRGAAESSQTNVERKTQGVHHHVRDLCDEGSSGERYGALR